jgi:uncharacterized protein (DUF2062 family)
MTEATAAEAPKGIWARMKAHILHPELTPEQVAWSFAIGLAMAWNPFLGTHTWIILAICFFARHLHRPLMLLACFVNNPWTLVPMATASTLLGNLVLGRGLTLDMRHVHWASIGSRSFSTREGFHAMMSMLRPILTPYLLGGFLFALLSLPLGYWFMLRLTLWLRARHHHATSSGD